MPTPAGFKDFAAEKLLSNDVDDYFMAQARMVFADAAARDAAITSPQEGMHVWLKDTDEEFEYDGTSWVRTRARVELDDETGTAYTLVLADAGALKSFSAAGAVTVTVPTNASVAYQIGTRIHVLSTGAGGVTVAGDTGVTVRNVATTLAQYEQGTLYKIAADEWVWVVENAASSGSSATLVRKTADESVASSTTPQDDDELTLSVAANEVWLLRVTLWMSGDAAADGRVTFSVPSGATSRFGPHAMASAAAGPTGDGVWSSTSAGTSISVGVTGTTFPNAITLWVYVANGATAGSVTLQWAQNATSATATTVHEGSHIVAHKVA